MGGTAAGVTKAATDATAKGATDAGIAATAAPDLGAVTAIGSGIGDAALGGLGAAGAGAAGLAGGSALADLGGAAGSVTSALPVDAGISAGLGGAAPAAGALSSSLPLETINVTGTAPAGLAPGASSFAPLAAGAGTVLAAGGAPGASPAGVAPSTPTPVKADSSLAAAGVQSGAGVDTGAGFGGDVGTVPPIGDSGVGADLVPSSDQILGPSASFGDTSSWDKLLGGLKTGKGFAETGLLGMSLMNALSKPKLPGAAQSALNLNTPLAQQAAGVISTGGTGSPAWNQQKASIDASIDQQIQQQAEALQQAAANSGEGNQNSGVVQQQLATMRGQLEQQRQALYLQAQQQNVAQAVTVLTGGNQVLDQIAQMQLNQSDQARAAASQTAELALLLASGTSNPLSALKGTSGG